MSKITVKSSSPKVILLKEIPHRTVFTAMIANSRYPDWLFIRLDTKVYSLNSEHSWDTQECQFENYQEVDIEICVEKRQ